MKYCLHCGKQLVDEAVACPGCGGSVDPIEPQTVEKTEEKIKYCVHCGKQLAREAAVCPGCGYSTEPATSESQSAPASTPQETPAAPKVAKPDKVSVGFCVLAFLFPLFGVIYWIVQYKETPKRAKACGICALISVIVSIVSSIVFYVISVLFSMLASLLALVLPYLPFLPWDYILG